MDDHVPILMYHSISEASLPHAIDKQAFATQMGLLAEEGFAGIRLRDALSHDVTTRNGKRPVVITFDDGYADAHSAALPILTQHGFQATMFVATGFVDAGVTCGGHPALTWPQVRELAALGMEMGSHTSQHPDLRGLDAEMLRREVEGSKLDLEDVIGEEVRTFAYPYGWVDPAAREAVRRAGYHAACAIRVPRGMTPDVLSLQRTGISHRDSAIRFRIKLSRTYQWLLSARLAGLLTLPSR